jgi:2-iminobutanoate/2-iminopropanoate deaminase
MTTRDPRSTPRRRPALPPALPFGCVLVCLLAGATAAQAQQPPAVEYLRSPATAALNLPFSDAVRVGDMLYLSGQIGNLPGELRLAPGGIRAEARQTLENIREILERNGSSMNRVVRCLVMLADVSEWGTFNEVYVTYFTGSLPARSAMGANGLALGARVEVECTATVGATPPARGANRPPADARGLTPPDRGSRR